jgi:hypothetical protein
MVTQNNINDARRITLELARIQRNVIFQTDEHIVSDYTSQETPAFGMGLSGRGVYRLRRSKFQQFDDKFSVDYPAKYQLKVPLIGTVDDKILQAVVITAGASVE